MNGDSLDDVFERWYSQKFASVPGARDEANKELARQVWNEILETAAEYFEFYDFEEYSGTQVAKTLRRMMIGGRYDAHIN